MVCENVCFAVSQLRCMQIIDSLEGKRYGEPLGGAGYTLFNEKFEDEIPLNSIMDKSAMSFMYSFSPDGSMLATSNGIVDRKGRIVSDNFPSNGVDKKSQGLMLDAIGWLDEDTAYIVDRLGITLYSISADTYRDATPGLADSFKQYPRKYQAYLNAVLIYFTYDTMYKIWQQDSHLFYVGRRTVCNLFHRAR